MTSASVEFKAYSTRISKLVLESRAPKKRLLRRIADAGYLLELLTSIQHNRLSASLVASRSYVHAAGFYKVVLVSDVQRRFQLRLHIWPTIASVDTDIHAHTTNLAALILFGQYVQRTFRVEAEGDRRWRYRFAYGSSGMGLTPEGVGYLKSNGSRLYREGECSTLRWHELHAIEKPPQIATASLVLQGRTVKREAIVYSRSARLPSNCAPQAYLTTLELRSCIETVVAHLKKREAYCGRSSSTADT